MLRFAGYGEKIMLFSAEYIVWFPLQPPAMAAGIAGSVAAKDTKIGVKKRIRGFPEQFCREIIMQYRIFGFNLTAAHRILNSLKSNLTKNKRNYYEM